MNKKKNIVAAFCVLSVLFTACQKEVESTTPVVDPPVPPVTNDSTFISKIIGLDTTKAAPFDTVFVRTFEYDAQKRVIKNVERFYNNTGGVDPNGAYIVTTKKYSGTDSLPYLCVVQNIDGVDNYTDSNFITYQAGLVSIDSLVYHDLGVSHGQVSRHYRNGSTIKQVRAFYNNNVFSFKDSVVYNLTKIAGNITLQTSVMSPLVTNTYKVTYDDKINPLAKAGVDEYASYAGFLDFHIGDDDEDPTYYLQPNNPTEIINDDGGQYNSHYTFGYKYNSLNYPTEILVKKISGNGVDIDYNKMLFKYRNL